MCDCAFNIQQENTLKLELLDKENNDESYSSFIAKENITKMKSEDNSFYEFKNIESYDSFDDDLFLLNDKSALTFSLFEENQLQMEKVESFRCRFGTL